MEPGNEFGRGSGERPLTDRGQLLAAVVCVKFSKLDMVKASVVEIQVKGKSLCSIGIGPSLRPDLPSGRAPRAAAVKDAAASAAAAYGGAGAQRPPLSRGQALDRASTVLG